MALNSEVFPPLSPLESTTSCAAKASHMFTKMLIVMCQLVPCKMSLEIVLTSCYLVMCAH